MRVTRVPYAVEGWGIGELWVADGSVVVAHDPPTPPRGTPGAPTDTLPAEVSREGHGFVSDVVQRIHRFFRGERVDFADVELELDWCTPFQRSVADALRRVPWGEVVSYGELAELAGHPRAARAAGTFCAENRYFLLVPCHRVVASAGLGSYGSLGVGYKRRLLELEGHAALG